MKSGVFLAAALAATGLAGAALAEGAVRAEDPSSIMAVLFDEGLVAKQEIDSYGDPIIYFRTGDRQYTIFFYDCTEGANCLSLQFYIGYETDGDVGVDFVNSMNSEFRFTSVEIDSEDDAIITLDVMTGLNGIAPGDFTQLLDLFVERAAEFEDRVGWVSE